MSEVVVDVPEVDLTDGKGGAVYVVQVAGVGAECASWTDIARVTAPARTKRATIIRAAVGSLGTFTEMTMRVLDADAAREHKVGLRERDPELVIA